MDIVGAGSPCRARDANSKDLSSLGDDEGNVRTQGLQEKLLLDETWLLQCCGERHWDRHTNGTQPSKRLSSPVVNTPSR
jgi:hypothetical protein